MKEAFKEYYNSFITVSSINTLLSEFKITVLSNSDFVVSKKADCDIFITYLSSLLQENAERIIKEKTEELLDELGQSSEISKFISPSIVYQSKFYTELKSHKSTKNYMLYALAGVPLAFTLARSLIFPIGVIATSAILATAGIVGSYNGTPETKFINKIIFEFNQRHILDQYLESISEYADDVVDPINVAFSNASDASELTTIDDFIHGFLSKFENKEKEAQI